MQVLRIIKSFSTRKSPDNHVDIPNDHTKIIMGMLGLIAIFIVIALLI